MPRHGDAAMNEERGAMARSAPLLLYGASPAGARGMDAHDAPNARAQQKTPPAGGVPGIPRIALRLHGTE
jgi:hypothetical protein